MKSVLMSIHPKWCKEIFVTKRKTIEVRKNRPKLETPFTVYVYQTKIKFKVKNWQENFQSIVFTPNGGVEEGNGKVIGSFVCDRVFELEISGDDCGNYWHEWDDEGDIQDMCLSYEELETYLGKSVGYGWHITESKLFDKPRELSEFKKEGFMSEEAWLCALYPNTHCHYKAWAEKFMLTHPPQSWCYIEEE